MYVCMYVCMYVYIYMYVCIYIHTHTHTYNVYDTHTHISFIAIPIHITIIARRYAPFTSEAAPLP